MLYNNIKVLLYPGSRLKCLQFERNWFEFIFSEINAKGHVNLKLIFTVNDASMRTEAA